jgi:hypothetical protein
LDKGGVAGGTKFSHNGIIFKFAVDESGLYGGNDELIMKTAAHDLVGLMALIECNISGLHFPLLALIDYLGYRLIACSILPIDRSTLVYGSSDAGKTVHDGSAEVRSKLREVAEVLNLKPHQIVDGSGTETTLYGPADLECHLGKDGRIYLIDTSRLFPPTMPTPDMPRSQYLWNRFRPIVVKQNGVPLSSDALSPFGRLSRQQDTEEIQQTTKRLLNKVQR